MQPFLGKFSELPIKLKSFAKHFTQIFSNIFQEYVFLLTKLKKGTHFRTVCLFLIFIVKYCKISRTKKLAC